MANKYGNVKVRGYDSKKEARRGDELRLLERAGKIRDLREQVPYELIPPVWEDIPQYHKATGRRIKDRRVIVERACKYVADFVYVDAETGETVVEDVKGYKSGPQYQLYVIKRKLMLQRYGIRIKEV